MHQPNGTLMNLRHRAPLTVFVGLTALIFFLHPQVRIFPVVMQRWIIPCRFVTLSLFWSVSQHEYAASAWTIMQRMGGADIVAELNGDGVHRLENVMTMEVGLHILFDCLALWFEATVRYYLIALAQICLTWLQYIRTCPTNIRYALSLLACSLVFLGQSLSLHRTMLRYLTHFTRRVYRGCASFWRRAAYRRCWRRHWYHSSIGEWWII